MTYLEILLYQERTMNDTLVGPWFGFRQDRDHFVLELMYLQAYIALLFRKGHI